MDEVEITERREHFRDSTPKSRVCSTCRGKGRVSWNKKIESHDYQRANLEMIGQNFNEKRSNARNYNEGTTENTYGSSSVNKAPPRRRVIKKGENIPDSEICAISTEVEVDTPEINESRKRTEFFVTVPELNARAPGFSSNSTHGRHAEAKFPTPNNQYQISFKRRISTDVNHVTGQVCEEAVRKLCFDEEGENGMKKVEGMIEVNGEGAKTQRVFLKQQVEEIEISKSDEVSGVAFDGSENCKHHNGVIPQKETEVVGKNGVDDKKDRKLNENYNVERLHEGNSIISGLNRGKMPLIPSKHLNLEMDGNGTSFPENFGSVMGDNTDNLILGVVVSSNMLKDTEEIDEDLSKKAKFLKSGETSQENHIVKKHNENLAGGTELSDIEYFLQNIEESYLDEILGEKDLAPEQRENVGNVEKAQQYQDFYQKGAKSSTNKGEDLKNKRNLSDRVFEVEDLQITDISSITSVCENSEEEISPPEIQYQSVFKRAGAGNPNILTGNVCEENVKEMNVCEEEKQAQKTTLEGATEVNLESSISFVKKEIKFLEDDIVTHGALDGLEIGLGELKHHDQVLTKDAPKGLAEIINDVRVLQEGNKTDEMTNEERVQEKSSIVSREAEVTTKRELAVDKRKMAFFPNNHLIFEKYDRGETCLESSDNIKNSGPEVIKVSSNKLKNIKGSFENVKKEELGKNKHVFHIAKEDVVEENELDRETEVLKRREVNGLAKTSGEKGMISEIFEIKGNKERSDQEGVEFSRNRRIDFQNEENLSDEILQVKALQNNESHERKENLVAKSTSSNENQKETKVSDLGHSEDPLKEDSGDLVGIRLNLKIEKLDYREEHCTLNVPTSKAKENDSVLSRENLIKANESDWKKDLLGVVIEVESEGEDGLDIEEQPLHHDSSENPEQDNKDVKNLVNFWETVKDSPGRFKAKKVRVKREQKGPLEE